MYRLRYGLMVVSTIDGTSVATVAAAIPVQQLVWRVPIRGASAFCDCTMFLFVS